MQKTQDSQFVSIKNEQLKKPLISKKKFELDNLKDFNYCKAPG